MTVDELFGLEQQYNRNATQLSSAKEGMVYNSTQREGIHDSV